VQEILWIFGNLQLTDVFDILIVALLFFGISFLFRGTQAMSLLRGLLILSLALVFLVGAFDLRALGWLLSNVLTVLVVAIPIVFQPELRRALEQIGRGGMIFKRQLP